MRNLFNNKLNQASYYYKPTSLFSRCSLIIRL